MTIVLGYGNQTLSDTGHANSIAGDSLGALTQNGGNDRIFGLDGNDIIAGDAYDGGAAPSIGVGFKGGNDLIDAGSGSDTIYGDTFGDIYGNGGNDTIYGGNSTGIDHKALYGDGGRMFGSAHGGNDVIRGGSSIDQAIYGDASFMTGQSIGGNDTISTESLGATSVYGDGFQIEQRTVGGSDKINGGSGTDFIYGDAAIAHGNVTCGKDFLYGNGGDDTIYGDTQVATVVSGEVMHFGNDSLGGGSGNDTIYGDTASTESGGTFVAGRDWITGGGGDDTLTGDAPGASNGAKDVFQFAPSFGNDTITDFQVGTDKLKFFSLEAGDFQVVDAGAGGNVTIYQGDVATHDNSITLTAAGGHGFDFTTDAIFA